MVWDDFTILSFRLSSAWTYHPIFSFTFAKFECGMFVNKPTSSLSRVRLRLIKYKYHHCCVISNSQIFSRCFCLARERMSAAGRPTHCLRSGPRSNDVTIQPRNCLDHNKLPINWLPAVFVRFISYFLIHVRPREERDFESSYWKTLTGTQLPSTQSDSDPEHGEGIETKCPDARNRTDLGWNSQQILVHMTFNYPINLVNVILSRLI